MGIYRATSGAIFLSPWPDLGPPPGSRVRFTSDPAALPGIHGRTGTVAGPDDLDGWVIVRLDTPLRGATRWDGRDGWVTELREAVDNLEVLP